MESVVSASPRKDMTAGRRGDAPDDEWSTKPTTLEETGISRWLLADLACKHLAEAGVLDLAEFAQRIALPGSVLEDLLDFLREEARVELRSRRDDSPLLRFGLTDAGRAAAETALQRDGYVGPAPVSLSQYEKLVAAQSARNYPVTREEFKSLFADTVIKQALLDRLGPAIHSGRAMFIHGKPGTGKSFIARRLQRGLGPPVLVPAALAVGETVIRVFDPAVHRAIERDQPSKSVSLGTGYDARLVLCERPLVVAGGELTMDVLDVQYDPSTRLHAAPLQLKANCGLLVIDDLGRQRLAPDQLLNRWILPMEEHRDQLTLRSGAHFSVPFDLTLVFSTNLQPEDLADEAFLRRIGYKIEFVESSPEEYREVWRIASRQVGIEYDDTHLDFVMNELYGNGTPLLPCHPRDLLQLCSDYLTYTGRGELDEETMRWAWNNYFLNVSRAGETMKARTVLTLLISLGLAGAAAYIANNWVNTRLGGDAPAVDMVSVVSAAADIPVGTTIEPNHLRVIQVPQGTIRRGAIVSVDAVNGRVAAQRIYEGEILVERRLAEHAGGSPLAALIEEGKRAVTVRVNDVIGVAGFLLPGNRVDVLATKRRTGPGGQTTSRTLLQNIKVLAVDQTVSTDKNEPVIVRAVTLEVSPEQAEQVVKATEEGTVQLTLRNPIDLEQRSFEPDEPPPPPPAPVAVVEAPKPEPKPVRRWRGYNVDIIRGVDVSRTRITN